MLGTFALQIFHTYLCSISVTLQSASLASNQVYFSNWHKTCEISRVHTEIPRKALKQARRMWIKPIFTITVAYIFVYNVFYVPCFTELI